MQERVGQVVNAPPAAASKAHCVPMQPERLQESDLDKIVTVKLTETAATLLHKPALAVRMVRVTKAPVCGLHGQWAVTSAIRQDSTRAAGHNRGGQFVQSKQGIQRSTTGQSWQR
jgi:hypothetical protein